MSEGVGDGFKLKVDGFTTTYSNYYIIKLGTCSSLEEQEEESHECGLGEIEPGAGEMFLRMEEESTTDVCVSDDDQNEPVSP